MLRFHDGLVWTEGLTGEKGRVVWTIPKSYVKRATMHENAAAGQLLKRKLTTLVSCERLRSKTVC